MICDKCNQHIDDLELITPHEPDCPKYLLHETDVTKEEAAVLDQLPCDCDRNFHEHCYEQEEAEISTDALSI